MIPTLSGSPPRIARPAFREPPSWVLVRRGIMLVVSVHAVLALWSGYRAIFQVLQLDVSASASPLRPGTSITYDILSSGRVPVTVLVELRQGSRAETLTMHRVRQNALAVYDPRVFRERAAIPIGASVLERFSDGPATVRVTGLGLSQFLRVPPPVTRERSVIISH